MFGLSGWSYALVCVGAPIVVGLTMYFGFGVWERRRKKSAGQELPPVDYSI